MVGEAEVARIIERDPAMASRLLRLANSAYFTRGSGGIGSIAAAVARLGLRQIHAMSLAVSVVRAFSGRGLDHRAFWRHSAAAAATAELLARQTGGPHPSEAYTAGLLHDVGLLVLDQYFSEWFTGVLAESRAADTALWRHEEARFGLDHGEVGGLLLARWSLPADIVEGVAHHHHPEQAPQSAQAMAGILLATEILVSETTCRLPAEGPPDATLAEAFPALGAAAIEDARRQLAEVVDAADSIASLL